MIVINLNDTLCKYCDIERKGYVTIGDVVFFFILYSTITVVICGLVYSIYQGLLIIASGNIFDTTYLIASINDEIDVLGLLLLLIIAAIIFVYIVDYIRTIKIAKCKLDKK